MVLQQETCQTGLRRELWKTKQKYNQSRQPCQNTVMSGDTSEETYDTESVRDRFLLYII